MAQLVFAFRAFRKVEKLEMYNNTPTLTKLGDGTLAQFSIVPKMSLL